MILYYIVLDITGKNLYPKKIFSKLKTKNFNILNSNSPNDIYKRTNKKYGYGNISLIYSNGLALDKEIVDFLKKYINFIKNNKGIRNYEITIWVNIYYNNKMETDNFLNIAFLDFIYEFKIILNMDFFNFSYKKIESEFPEYFINKKDKHVL